MKPAPFKYYAPRSAEEALADLVGLGYEGKALAGGQSLIPMMNFRLAQPAALVDLNPVTELAYIRPARDGGLLLGAMTRQRQLEHDPLVADRAPMLHAAMPKIAYPQIRTRGTLGGSLSHADPSAELPAVTVALQARFRLRRQSAERWVPASEFFQGFFTTSLEPDELLVEVALPPMPPNSGWSFLEVARRHHDFALVGAAAVVTLDARKACQEARLVYFSVGDGPVVAQQAAALLRGQAPTPEALRAAAEAAGDLDVDPTTDINASAEFRRHLVKVLGRRALAEAVQRAGLPSSGGSAPSGGEKAGAGGEAGQALRKMSELPTISVVVNGTRYERSVEPRLLLSDFLRHHLGLTGTHVGCEHGVCGACTILYDGLPARSCLMFAVQANGHEVTTVEGLGTPEKLHPLQQAFWEAHAAQCGFCTPGILMSLVAFLRQNSDPSEQEIREALSGNLCRCTGYQHIVDAARLAAERMRAQ